MCLWRKKLVLPHNHYNYFMQIYRNLGLAAAAILASCSQFNKPAQTPVITIEKQVLAVHDEVMPRMGEVVALADKADSLVRVDSLTYKPIADALHKADRDMMHWMRSYHLPTDETEEVQRQYLQHQQVLVDTLRADILRAIEQAKAVIK